MKVLVLGAAAEIGQVVSRVAYTLDGLDALILADLNEQGVLELARELGPKASALALDVADPLKLRAALEQVDVVASVVGPFYRFGVEVLRAAIETGTHYLDICDDWEPTVQMLELDGEAKSAGITAIIGMGASPGLNNLLCAKVLSMIDEPKALSTGFDWDSSARGDYVKKDLVSFRPSAAFVHGLHGISGKIRVYESGAFQLIDALRPHTLTYPGRGAVNVYTAGHPEPVTLPLTFPELEECHCYMAISEEALQAIRPILPLLRDEGLSAEDAAVRIIRSSNLKPFSRDSMPLPSLYAVVSGERCGVGGVTIAGTMASYPVIPGVPAGMAAGTGIPMAVGIGLMLDGKITRRGVMAPEACIEPDVFFDQLHPFCSFPVSVERDELIVVSENEDHTF